MPFVAGLKRSVEASGSDAPLDVQLKFHELDTLDANLTYLRRELASYDYIGRDIDIVLAKSVRLDQPVSGGGKADAADIRLADAALPGQPTYRIL